MLLARRAAVALITPLFCSPPAQPARAAPAFDDLRSRLDAPIVKEPSAAPGGGEPALPAWLEGTWRCEQTLTRFTTPLGVAFIGAPGRPISEAEASAAQTRAQLNVPVSLPLRWIKGRDGSIVEDRPFNVKSRLDAFAGRSVVRDAEACAATSSFDVLAGRPLACTLVDFKGPVSQKVLVNSARSAMSSDGGVPSDAVVLSEFVRSIFARKLAPGDTRNFPPITTDTETVLELAPSTSAPSSVLVGRLRLISYLQPLDPLYFEAAQRSVSVSDYSLRLERMPDAAPVAE